MSFANILCQKIDIKVQVCNGLVVPVFTGKHVMKQRSTGAVASVRSHRDTCGINVKCHSLDKMD